MATAAEVLKAALQRILVQASEADLEADEYQDAIFSLNHLMTSYEADGIRLGYTQISGLGDDITVPAPAVRGIVANLAIEVSPDYNGTISPGLLVAAKDGLTTMRRLNKRATINALPSLLPIGSGNYDRYATGGYTPDFYSGVPVTTENKIVIALAGNATATSTTAGIKTIVSGTWTQTENFGFEIDLATTKITYTGTATSLVFLPTILTGLAKSSTSAEYIIGFRKNGLEIVSSTTVTLGTSNTAFAISAWGVQLEQNDYLELTVEPTGTAYDVTVASVVALTVKQA